MELNVANYNEIKIRAISSKINCSLHEINLFHKSLKN